MKAAEIAAPSLILDKEFEESGRSIGWLLEMLAAHNPRFVEAMGDSKVERLSARDISDGRGFCSRIYRTTAHFATARPAYSFVLKVPTVAPLVQLVEGTAEAVHVNKHAWAVIVRGHNLECAAYRLMAGIPDFPLPEVFFSLEHTPESGGMIAMQDLSGVGANLPLGRSLSARQCVNFARSVADFQACMLGKEDEWKGRFGYTVHIQEEFVFDFAAKGVPKILEHNGGELRKELKDILSLDWFAFSKWCVRDVAAEMNALVLVHGDCWGSNVMMRLAADGSIGDHVAAFIDWQNLFEGNPLFDVARFLVVCADADVRREVERAAVDAYFDRLSDKLQRNGQKPRFSREDAHMMFEVAVAHQTAVLATIFAFVVLPPAARSPVDAARAAKVWLRLKFALEDQQALFEKHGLLQRFRKHPSVDEGKKVD
ncbi:hypothetical protein M3Y99_01458700 [Aphelenchoides fujianensis]|nr:hypothetical protein M3Y99_01458700 [Aphelenchoides fujianensis]